VDLQTARDHIEDLIIERDGLLARLREIEATSDDCPPHGIPRPHLRLYEVVDDIPLVFWDLHIYAHGDDFIRVTTFMSADKKKTEHIVETGSTLAGPWLELRRKL